MYTRPVGPLESRSALLEDPIGEYFKIEETLVKEEQWEEIIQKSKAPLAEAIKINRHSAAANIYFQRTSAFFKLGKYIEARENALCCDKLMQSIENPILVIQALYLKSAVYRALASKELEPKAKQEMFLQAVEIAESACQIYTEKSVENENLLGKVFFNLGAAHADNPHGDLQEAEHCYQNALKFFKNSGSFEEEVRTNVRLGKIYLIKKDYSFLKELIHEARATILPDRLTMHIDYLEAQYLLAIGDCENGERVTKSGLSRAICLRAEEDQLRFNVLLQEIIERQ